MPHDTDGIRWPARFEPSFAPIHVRNEVEVLAPIATAWAWLVRAPLWPQWYSNSKNVEIVEGPPHDLALGSLFRWSTFGVTITSRVIEFIPGERLAWDAHGIGVEAYHAWLFRGTETGCHLLTEETQHGWAVRIGATLMPNRMSEYHQIWLDSLAERARSGPPPEVS